MQIKEGTWKTAQGEVEQEGIGWSRNEAAKGNMKHTSSQLHVLLLVLLHLPDVLTKRLRGGRDPASIGMRFVAITQNKTVRTARDTGA